MPKNIQKTISQKSILKYINDNKDSIKRDIGLDITSTLLEQGGINASRFGVFINTAGGVKGPAGSKFICGSQTYIR